MCCPLCEEPVRSTLFGLAAIGIIAIFRTLRNVLKSWRAQSVAGRAS